VPGKILVAVELSDVGRSALDAAIGLAKDLCCSLVLLHAFQRAFMAPEVTPAIAARVQDMEGRLEEGQAIDLSTKWASRARASGLAVETETAEGDIATVIVEAARRHDALLIVVGTHGRTGLRRLLEGSVAEVVVRHADRPVLVVPHRDEAKGAD
jgi:nucleotide-binding universal stress UspA family protein